MDYKKKYKDALERARQVHATNVDENKKSTEYIFPELKDSEGEKIRKEILEYFQQFENEELRGVNISDWIAWLEKQGDTNETINRHVLAKGVLRGAAITLITWIDYNRAKGNMCLSNMECEDIEDALVSGDWNKIYAYIKKKLEKQGDKPLNDTDEEIVEAVKDTSVLDMVEPKFKQGEWIVWKDKYYKVNYNGCGYELFDQNGLSTSWDYKTIEDNVHLWTIQDAKDGDVLQLGEVTVIFKEYNGDGTCRCYCSICEGEFEIPADDGFDNAYGCYNTTPATKEQRDLLFTKMKEAGYEWDAEKKELKNIEPKTDIEMITPEESLGIDSETYNKIVDECIYGEQKPINEDAENEKSDYVSGQFLYCKGSFNEFKEGESYWLEYIGNDTYVGRSDNILNQKFHITPRQLYTWLDPRHPENSKEDVPMSYGKELDAKLRDACARYYSNGGDTLSLAGVFYAGVEAQKEIGQKPLGWSEEDERLCSCLIEEQEEALDNVKNDKYGHSEIISDLKEMYNERIDWLKSLKDRYTWKPSDLVIEALESATTNCAYSEYVDCLKELIKQLKQL